ncbi:MAG: exodeoxyribonuclease V subunit gamma, partial [Gammaproteobacteria bacterium]
MIQAASFLIALIGSLVIGAFCLRGLAVAALERDPALAALPERLSLFGPTRLPADHLTVLAALARHRD